MSEQLDLFHFEEGPRSFEDFAQANGETYWWASEFQTFLGYENWSSFNKVINRSMTACNTLNIPLMENFKQVERIIDGHLVHDFKLSRFACYLIAMNGDTKKEPVAKAQAYFATLAGAVENYMIAANNIERVVIRDEITDREKSLGRVAQMAQIVSYPLFQNAGYRGMYNMNLARLRTVRNIPAGRSPLDFMGKEELAANLFRITQTELKITGENIRGQQGLEFAAEAVGRKVRKTMQEISGITPDQLPSAQDIKQVHKNLKAKNKELRKADNPSNKKKRGLGPKR
ncbi:MAG TPA: hypothetical protein PLO50_12275 [Nitrospira sp.]|nr:hypothetical protein [Nitrospira sp.]